MRKFWTLFGLIAVCLGAVSLAPGDVAARFRCVCIIILDQKAVPDIGAFTITGRGGTVYVGADSIATLDSLTITMTNSLSDPNHITGQVTALRGVVSPFNSPVHPPIAKSVWTLAPATGTCVNQIVFDKSVTDSTVGNITGCAQMKVSGGLSQNGVNLLFTGSNFDPAGVRRIKGSGSSDNFDLSLIGRAVPGLPWWGPVAMVLILSGAGLLALRRRRLA